MTTYRTQPAEVQAIQVDKALTQATNAWNLLPKWFVEAYDAGLVLLVRDGIYLHEIRGGPSVHIPRTDWLVHLPGKLTVCDAALFALTYKIDEKPTKSFLNQVI